jgi:hypothetical protein
VGLKRILDMESTSDLDVSEDEDIGETLFEDDSDHRLHGSNPGASAVSTPNGNLMSPAAAESLDKVTSSAKTCMFRS